MDASNDQGDEMLGRGIAFPLRLEGGTIAMNAFDAQVRQSILLVLRTARGERAMRPDFGAGMETLAFEPMSAVTVSLVRHRVKEALVRFEPRIQVLDVTAEAETAGDGARLLVRIGYRVKRTDTVHNLVYPFYIERGEA